MTDKEFDEFLAEGLKQIAEEMCKEIESDPSYKDVEVPKGFREKLMKRIMELEKGGC